MSSVEQWVPKCGEKCWYTDKNAFVRELPWWGGKVDLSLLRAGCVYRTREEAEAALAKMNVQPEPEAQPEGRKDDAGKDPWDLVPFDAVREIVKVLAFGAKKYSERNWEAGMAWSRPFSACMRHLTAWWEGEDKDPETGISHLAHAGCCVLFLLAYSLRGKGKDDRPKNSG